LSVLLLLAKCSNTLVLITQSCGRSKAITVVFDPAAGVTQLLLLRCCSAGCCHCCFHTLAVPVQQQRKGWCQVGQAPQPLAEVQQSVCCDIVLRRSTHQVTEVGSSPFFTADVCAADSAMYTNACSLLTAAGVVI
jgi:hypothetical protein